MNFRSTALLFGLLVGMLWLFGFMLAYKKTAFEANAIMPSLAQEHVIDDIVIQRQGKDAREFTFTKVNDHWVLQSGSTKMKLEDFRINNIAKEVKDARRNEEADVSDNPSTFGLDNPQVVVSIKGRVGSKKDREQTWKLKIGKESADKSLVFVSSSDRPTKIFAVDKKALASIFFTDVNHLRSRELFEFNDIAVKKLVIKEATKNLEIAKGPDETWQIVQPPLGLADYEGATPPKEKELPPGARFEAGGVKSLLTTIRGMRVESEEDFVAATETDFANFGLEDGKEKLRVQIADEKKEETLLIGKRTPSKDEQYFARLASDPGMFKLTGKQLEPIRKALEDPGQFRARDVTPLDTKKVEQVKITANKEVVQLTRPDDKSWQAQTDAAKPVKASDKAVQSFLEAIQGKREIQKFLDAGDPEAKKLDAEPTAEIALFLEKKEEKKDEKKKDDAKKEEKKDTKPAVTFFFGKLEKDAMPVKRLMADGTTTRFTITKTLAETILPGSGALAFLDTALPVLPLDDVAAITILRGKDKTEIVRGQDKAQRWIFKDSAASQEQTFADSAKVEAILKRLGNLEASRWLQKADAKTDLDKFGLKDPAIVVTFTVKRSLLTLSSILGLLATPDGGPLLATVAARGYLDAYPTEIVTVRLGKETDDAKKKETYAQHTGSDLLFVLPSELGNILKNLDLRDRSTLLTFQPTLGAAAVAAGPLSLLATTPLLSGQVQTIDPATVKELKIDVRTPAELRKFHFVRDKDTWTDQSKLIEFNLDHTKVKSLVDDLGKLTAERIVSLAGPRPEFKFGPRDATLKVDFILDTGRTVTLTAGDLFENTGYFAHSTDLPAAVFVIGRGKIEPYLRGALYFGKERQVAAE